MYPSDKKISVLHIILTVRETSAPYNEHCLPWAEQRDISICAYFESDVKPPENITYFEGDGTLRGFFRTLKTALDAKAYDIIHTHSPHVGLLFLLGTRLGHRDALSSSVATVHDSYQNFKTRNRLMFIPIFASFKKVICCGKASYQSFPAFYKHLAKDRLGAVQNGLDIERVDRIAANTPKKATQASDFTVIAISRLVDIKNPITLLTAFQGGINKTSRLIYMGDGPLREQLLVKNREANTESQVVFTGLIPRESVFENLSGADLFLSTSRGEGLPIAVMEAMACGLPVVLSDIPPHREIAEGVDFIPLVLPDDVAGFAREIKKFREMSIAERTTIGQKCRQRVEERFSLPAMHAGYAEVYAEITGEPVPFTLEAVQ